MTVYFDFQSHNFDNFFSKECNEPFCANVLKSLFSFDSVKHGNDADEPDLFFDDKELFEVALISDKKKHGNLIQRIKSGSLHSEDIDTELFSMIEERIEDKSKKCYINMHPNLCLISSIPLLDWICSDEIIDKLYISERRKKFNSLYEKYVKAQVFKNIFLLIPSPDEDWWLIDLKYGKWNYEGDKNDPSYPFFTATRFEIIE